MSAVVLKPNNIDTINVKHLRGDAHWKWMSLGWQDLKNSLPASIKIGASIVIISLVILSVLYSTGLGTLIPAAIGAFALAGPILATFIYGISRKLEDGRKVQKLRSVNMHPQSPAQVGLIGFALLFLVLAWARVALLLYAVATGLNTHMNEVDFMRFVLSTPEGLTMMVIGTAFGAALALVGFAISAISIPLAFDRDIDAISAMAISVKAIAKNPMTMLSWAFVISMMVAVSAMFLFLPLIIIFPWLGHVTWHAYRDTID